MSNVPFGFQPPEPPDDSNSGQPPGPGQNPFDMGNLGSALSQLGAMLQNMSNSPDQGAVNWSAATDVARKAIAAAGDPVVADAQQRAVTEAVRLADLWLDPITSFPTTGAGARAWSRSQWLDATMPAWQAIITPIAEQVQSSMSGMMPSADDLRSGLPEELRAMLPADMPVDLTQMLGPLLGMARQMGASMFAMQAGQGLAGLAGEVLGAGDVGLPLTSDGIPTLVPENIAEFGRGLEIDAADLELYLALREVAHQRLFTHVPWLGPTVRDAVAEYARGIGLDTAAMEEAMRGIDLSDPANLQQALSSGVLAPQDTPEQKAALARLETLLALVEGWVDHVVSAAVGGRLGTASRLQEAVRRRRAVGGPAEKTFQTLVGLEMRPRRLREAAALWAELERVRGIEGRDAVWEHPDLLPGPADLDDPTAFVSGSSISDSDLAALASGEVVSAAQPPPDAASGEESASDTGTAPDESTSDAGSTDVADEPAAKDEGDDANHPDPAGGGDTPTP